MLTRVPAHRGIVRLIFECIEPPKQWMVRQLQDPSFVCHDDLEEAAPAAGTAAVAAAATTAGPATAAAAVRTVEAPVLRPRRAQLVGTELLHCTLATKLDEMKASTGVPLSNDMLIEWSNDVLDAIWHLYRQGVIHRDLKLDNIMWDPSGGPEGVGRLVLIDFGSSLIVDVGRSRCWRSCKQIEDASFQALNKVSMSFLENSGGNGGNSMHTCPEVLDGWSSATAGTDAGAPDGADDHTISYSG